MEIMDELKEVAKTGILPDGDHVNEPTRMWLEEIIKKDDSGKAYSLLEFMEKYLPKSELIIVNKKDIKDIKFHIRMLHGGGYHDVEEFYKE